MDSVNYKNKNTSENTYGHKYNLQHIVFISKYRYKVFKNPKTLAIIRTAMYDAAKKHKMIIKEISFGEDFAHVHMEVSIPNIISVLVCGTITKRVSFIYCIQGNAETQTAIF